MLHHDFRRFLDALDELNPAQIEDAQTEIRNLRRQTKAISEIEARTNQDCKCPFCRDDRRRKWGARGPRSSAIGAMTYSGRTEYANGRIHRPDLFMVAAWDMLGASTPQSVCKLANPLGLNQYTVWRWRMLVFSIIGGGTVARFSGILDADETYQR